MCRGADKVVENWGYFKKEDIKHIFVLMGMTQLRKESIDERK